MQAKPNASLESLLSLAQCQGWNETAIPLILGQILEAETELFGADYTTPEGLIRQRITEIRTLRELVENLKAMTFQGLRATAEPHFDSVPEDILAAFNLHTQSILHAAPSSLSPADNQNEVPSSPERDPFSSPLMAAHHPAIPEPQPPE